MNMNFVGNKFDVNNSNRYNLTWIASQLREELKEFTENWQKKHPVDNKKSWKFSVKKENSCLIITISKFPYSAISHEYSVLDMCGNRSFNPNKHFKDEVMSELRHVCNQYNYDNSEVMCDYFDCNYYLQFYPNYNCTEMINDGDIYKVI